MARYFFHLRDGDVFVEDETGMDVGSLDAARAEAIQSARDILAEQLRAGQPLDGQQIEVQDDRGNVVLTLPFKDVFRLSSGMH